MTTVITLTGDEAALLRSLDNAIAKEKQHEDQLNSTGKTGERVSDSLKDDFATLAATNDKAFAGILRDLRRAGPEGRATAAELQKHFAATGTAGYSSISTIIDRLAAIDPAAAAAAKAVTDELAAADTRANFNATLAQLQRLGPEGKAIADGIAADLAAADAKTEFAKTHAELQQLAAEGDTFAQRIVDELAEADAKTEFNKTIAQLKRLGPEAAAIANGILEEFDAVDVKTEFNDTITKLKQLGPEGQATADRIVKELADADARTEFNDTLTQLRKLGPEGRAIAKGIQEDLDAADAAAAGDMTSVLARLKEINPTVEASAKRVREELGNAAESGEISFATFATNAGKSIGTFAASYVGVSTAIQEVTEFLTQQEKVLDSALMKQLELGKAQQESAKNLAGFTELQRSELLQKSVPEIARQTGVSDLTAITTALGDVASGGSTYEQTANTVKQAARFQSNSPEKLAKTSVGAIATQNLVGLDDVRKAIALFTTAGTESRITDPTKLIENLPVAVGSAVATVRNQEREEAAREAAALYGTITKAANDDQGNSSTTFSGQFTSKLGTFFDDFEGELRRARSKIQGLDKTIATGNSTEDDRFNRDRLVEFVTVGERIQKESSGTAAFETISGRIKTIADNPELETQFSGPEGFGEERYKPFLKDIFDSESETAKGFLSAFEKVQVSVDSFERTAKELASGTPQLVLSNISNRVEAAKAAAEFSNIEGASLASVRKHVAETLAENRSTGVAGFTQSQGEYFIGSGSLEGSTAAEETIAGIATLFKRSNDLSAGGITTDEQIQIERITATADALRDSITLNANRLEPASLNRESLQAGTIAELTNANGLGNFETYFRDLQTELANLSKSIEKQNAISARTADATETTAKAAESTAKATDTTAKNTQPKPSDPNAAQRAIIAANASRSIAP